MIKYVYVCSAARCGSTLTDMFLGGHSQVASLGELNYLGKTITLGEACSCGQVLRDCPEWNAVFARIRQDSGIDLIERPYDYALWDAISYVKADPGYQTPGFIRAMKVRTLLTDLRRRLPATLRAHVPLPPRLSRAVANKLAMYDAIASAWDKRLVVDSSKNIREALELYWRRPDAVRIVFVTRDGRGVFLSRRKSGRSQAESLRGWHNYYRRALSILAEHVPEAAHLRIRYEDLAADPETMGKKLCAFLGIDFEPGMLDLGRAERHIVNGNATRFNAGRGIKLDERWRDELSGDDLAYFTKFGRAMNRRLGYQA